MRKWQLQEAKAKLSEVMRATKKAPQLITYRGSDIDGAILISMREYENLIRSKPGFVEFMRKSPLCGAEVDFDKIRDRSKPRNEAIF